VNAARKENPLRVVNDQKGSPSYSKDLAAHTQMMIAAGCRSTYHVTNSGYCTWYELASEAVVRAGMKSIPITPVPSSEFPRPAARPANSVLANALSGTQRISLDASVAGSRPGVCGTLSKIINMAEKLTGEKSVATNKKAYHEYFILERSRQELLCLEPK